RRVPDRERRARLARRHRLTPAGRTDDVEAIFDDLVALHSSDPATVYLSVVVRMKPPEIAAIEHALSDDRSVVRHHAMRRTMWVMTPATARRAHAAATVKIAATDRKRTLAALDRAPEIEDPEGWLDAAEDEVAGLIAERGPMTARAVGEALPHLVTPIVFGHHTSNPASINAHTKVLQQGGFNALLVRACPTGSWISSEYAWSEVDAWLGSPIAGAETRSSAAELLDHWLHRFGPATDVDVRWWFGWTATIANAALADAGAVRVDLDDGGEGWLAADDLDAVEPVEPWVRLLPGLDVTTMGWKRRDWYLDPAMVARLFDRFGNAGPTIWADGRVVGGWIQRPGGGIVLDLLEPPAARHRAMLDDAIAELEGVLGDTAIKPRFPSPNQRELLA
ncbi:MAG: winged helix DNA-binding domain-containing protein, partial [Ilumatobacteraceae bacterium]